MYPGWYFCLEKGFWEHFLSSEDAICWTWQRSSLVPENSCFLETQSSYQRCGGLGDFGYKLWLWKRSGRCGWRGSMAPDRGKKTRRVNTQDWNGRESYKGTKRASPPLQEVVITWQSMTGASHCSLSFPGKMSSLPPSFHTLRWQPWKYCQPISFAHHSLLQPDDWLALSCTCKAFNKMVSCCCWGIVDNWIYPLSQVKEFTKQNKRLVFQPESGSAQIFKQLTRFFCSRAAWSSWQVLNFRHSVSLRVAGFPFCTWLTDELLQPVRFVDQAIRI